MQSTPLLRGRPALIREHEMSETKPESASRELVPYTPPAKSFGERASALFNSAPAKLAIVGVALAAGWAAGGGYHGYHGYHAWYGAPVAAGVAAGAVAGAAIGAAAAAPYYPAPACGYYPYPPCY